MSQLREYAGKSWHEWPSFGDHHEELSLSSSPSHSDMASGDITPSSSRASSPPPNQIPRDDVMKLPRRDMHMFGQCPVQDDFTLAVCDNCGLVVKIEALASHVKLRHGLPLKLAQMSSVQTSTSGRSSRGSVKPCSVDLQKLSAQLKSESNNSSKGSSISTGSSSINSCPPPSRSKTPTPDKELFPPPVSPASLMAPASAIVKTEIMTIKEESMEVENPKELSVTEMDVTDDMKVESESFLTKFSDEDMDSNTTSNVISIPDTDPLPHNMSGDLMAMVSEVTRPLENEDIPTINIREESPVIQLHVQQDENAATTTTLLLAPSIVTPLPVSITASTATSSPFVSRPSAPTPIIVQSPSTMPMGIKTILPNQSIINKQSPGKKGPGMTRVDRKPLREYHPDKHCGVWDNEGSRHCTRALTCKSHSVLLKRKVDGRSRSFDELLAAHKKAQAALAAAATIQTSSPIVSPTITLPTTPIAPPALMQLTGTPMRTGGITLATNKPGPPHIMFPLTPVQQTFHSPNDVEESLHYTNDHPKPLAVCTFAGRRIGGLMFSDRSRLLTRKLVRVAITTAVPGMGGTRTSGVSGFHRIGPRLTLFQGESSPPLAIVNGLKRPRDTKEPTFLLNYSLGGKRTVVGGGGGTLTQVPATATMNLSTLQPGASVVIPDSFKTDIQDFKGGIKFELGSKIKLTHLPSGGDIP